MGRIIDNYVRQQLNWEESIVFVLHYRPVSFMNAKTSSLFNVSIEEPCTKRNKYIPTPSAIIFLSIFYNGSTVGYSRTIRRILLNELKVSYHQFHTSFILNGLFISI